MMVGDYKFFHHKKCCTDTLKYYRAIVVVMKMYINYPCKCGKVHALSKVIAKKTKCKCGESLPDLEERNQLTHLE